MKIKEYLKTLDPKQQVMVVVQDTEGERHIVACHEAGYLATSNRSPWRELEVLDTIQRKNDILVVTKLPEENK